MEQMADNLAALLDTLGIGEPVVFVGLSMGGYIAFAFWRNIAPGCGASSSATPAPPPIRPRRPPPGCKPPWTCSATARPCWSRRCCPGSWPPRRWRAISDSLASCGA